MVQYGVYCAQYFAARDQTTVNSDHIGGRGFGACREVGLLGG